MDKHDVFYRRLILQRLLSFIRVTPTKFANFTRKNAQYSEAVVNLVSSSKHYSCRLRCSVSFGLIRERCVPNQMIFLVASGIKNVPKWNSDSWSIHERMLVSITYIYARVPVAQVAVTHASSGSLLIAYCV